MITWTLLPVAAEGDGVQRHKSETSIVRSPLRAREKGEPDPDAHGRSIFLHRPTCASLKKR